MQLYDYAEQQNYDIYWYNFDLPDLESLSVIDTEKKCYIAIDPFKLRSDADELVKGLHELGHCDTGSFYNQYATCDIRQKHENRADRRAIELRLSVDDLNNAINSGYSEIWELAEYFGVTEDFMRKAVCYYTTGTLVG